MGNESHDFLPESLDSGPQPGPSWARPDWRGTEDDLTQALDPTQMQVAIKAAAARGGAALDPRAIEEAAADSIRAMMLVRTYRVRGHLGADLDPLGLSHQNLPADLDPAYHGFTGAALDRIAALDPAPDLLLLSGDLANDGAAPTYARLAA